MGKKSNNREASPEPAEVFNNEPSSHPHKKKKNKPVSANEEESNQDDNRNNDSNSKRKHLENDGAYKKQNKKSRVDGESEDVKLGTGGDNVSNGGEGEIKKVAITVSGQGAEDGKFAALKSFDASKLPKEVLECCKNFSEPSPIQSRAWPFLLDGRDFIGIAATGSGKTLAFGIPALVHVLSKRKKKTSKTINPLCLVLSPTRELAQQISDVLVEAGTSCNVTSVCVYGGTNKGHQIAALNSGVDIVIGTPGRLKDLINMGVCCLDEVSFVVLDEADRMLDMGFEQEVRSILSKTASVRQMVMFSATWPFSVHQLAQEFMDPNPVKVVVGSGDLAANHDVMQIAAAGFDHCDYSSVFVSLCFRATAPVRAQLLSNAGRFSVQPHLLLTLFLGFTKDPYPNVRAAALDGLGRVCSSIDSPDDALVRGCYFRAVDLLVDLEDCVRLAALRTVSAWGQLLVALSHDNEKGDLSNSLFLQLCSMARDMCVEVRIECFLSLGKIEMVSDDLLLQSLSKKLLPFCKENKFLNQHPGEHLKLSTSSAAGTFAHGLEDEFYEVRGSACRSLRKLVVLSSEFAGQTLNWLMDMLNDDSSFVRIQALETMHYLATFNYMKVLATHMHMFLGTLVGADSVERSTARKVLQLIRLPTLGLFRTAVDGIITNLELYPQDEADIFSCLFNIGRNHGSFVVSIVKRFFHEMEPPCDSKSRFRCPRVGCMVVLAISAPLSMDQNVPDIPAVIYSYAVTLLGKISYALMNVMNRRTLFAYLSKCSRSTSSAKDSPQKGSIFPLTLDNDVMSNSCFELVNSITFPWHDGHGVPPHEKIIRYLQDSFQEIHIWPLMKSGCIKEVLRRLRICKEELGTVVIGSHESLGLIAFALKYCRAIKLIVKTWAYLSGRECLVHGIGEPDILLDKLDMILREMKYIFIGFSDKEEIYLLDLMLLTCILRLYSSKTCCHHTVKKKLFIMMSCRKVSWRNGSAESSRLVTELENLLSEVNGSTCEALCDVIRFKNLLGLSLLEPFPFSSRLACMKVELDVQENNSENPLLFVAGLPAGLPVVITLYNIASNCALWLEMAADEEASHFVFLDVSQFEGCDAIRKLTRTVPFYYTPKAISFILRVSVALEYFSDDVQKAKQPWGPKHELTYLCRDTEVHLSMVDQRQVERKN